MTLAKALKHKKRVLGKINRVTKSIHECNSVLAENTPRHDVLELVKTRQLLVDHLIAVKVAINRANDPMPVGVAVNGANDSIVEDIYRLAELRGDISFWEGINTTDGRVARASFSHQADADTYKATIKENDVEEKVAELEKRIDEIQDKLDEHNATTKININIPEIML